MIISSNQVDCLFSSVEYHNLLSNNNPCLSILQSPGVWKSQVNSNDNHWSQNYVAPQVAGRYRNQYSASSEDQQEISNIGYTFSLTLQIL